MLAVFISNSAISKNKLCILRGEKKSLPKLQSEDDKVPQRSTIKLKPVYSQLPWEV